MEKWVVVVDRCGSVDKFTQLSRSTSILFRENDRSRNEEFLNDLYFRYGVGLENLVLDGTLF